MAKTMNERKRKRAARAEDKEARERGRHFSSFTSAVVKVVVTAKLKVKARRRGRETTSRYRKERPREVRRQSCLAPRTTARAEQEYCIGWRRREDQMVHLRAMRFASPLGIRRGSTRQLWSEGDWQEGAAEGSGGSETSILIVQVSQRARAEFRARPHRGKRPHRNSADRRTNLWGAGGAVSSVLNSALLRCSFPNQQRLARMKSWRQAYHVASIRVLAPSTPGVSEAKAELVRSRTSCSPMKYGVMDGDHPIEDGQKDATTTREAP
ncbi:hypothetical protein C8R45DRAFT_948016 [Mycena sanguinolenta]|nr:hypothetical protein C8R45DRAFT_948016 [Mycena sanguinolenta]